MLKHIALAIGLALVPAAAMAEDQGQPNGLPEPQNEMMRLQEYVIQHSPRSFTYSHPVMVGTVLPARGVSYYQVPPEYGFGESRYTVVNHRAVLVDPQTRRVFEVIQ
jgi:hypothetical protein